MTETFEKEAWVSHPPCSQTWRIAFLPMAMGKLALVMKGARCPKCGEKKGIMMATKSEIEAAHAR